MAESRSRSAVTLLVQGATLGILALLLWRVETMIERSESPHQMSGQVITEGPVQTERYIDEDLSGWKERHDEALDAFNASREEAGE